jgi:hypothetical protein
LEELKVLARGCDHVGIDVSENSCLRTGCADQDFTHRVEDCAVTGVVEWPGAFAVGIDCSVASDSIDRDEVRLVLDRSGPSQRLPMVAALCGPVCDQKVRIGVVGDGPEFVSET